MNISPVTKNSNVQGKLELHQAHELIGAFAISLALFIPFTYFCYQSFKERKWVDVTNCGIIALSSAAAISGLMYSAFFDTTNPSKK
jgi:hypothetical protein